MSEAYLDDEKVITGYDPHIVRRLLAFLKPHKLAMIGAVVALAIATAAELGMPVIVQRAMDQHLITKYLRVPAEEADHPSLEQANIAEKPRVGDYYYVLESDLTFLSGVDRSSLRQDDILSDTVYYVFPRDDQTNGVIRDHRTLFLVGDEHGAIPRDDLSGLARDEVRALRHADIEGIIDKAWVFLGLLVAILIFMFLQVVLMAYTGQGIMKDLRTRLFNHLIRQSLRFLNSRPVGRLVSRITNDVETINELFTQVLANLLKNVVMMLGVVVTLFLIDPLLAAVAMATLPPVFIITAIFRRRARDAFRQVRSWVSRVNAFLAEHIGGMSVVQMFVQERRTDRAFDDRNDRLLNASLGEMYVFATFRPIVDLLSSVSIAVVIYFGAFFLIQGLVSLGILVAFINLIRRFYRQLMEISERFVIVQSALAGSERVFSLLDESDTIPDTGTGRLPEPVRGAVQFENVWFSYKEDEPVIKDLSFRVAPGETVAIVGYTGAGKTTIANLLTRLWDVDAGHVRVDGVDVRDVPLADLRRVIQPIQQDVFLFRETIEENIRLGTDADGHAVVDAAKAVQAHRFVEKMPSGYETQLEEGAANVSTGQRQLLSFARVIAHDPRIIILDEATSSIDTETERLIQNALRVLLKDRTSLVIAHRLSTIRHADRILVLAAGRLVEQGTHEELLAHGGVYYNLYKLQYAQQ